LHLALKVKINCSKYSLLIDFLDGSIVVDTVDSGALNYAQKDARIDFLKIALYSELKYDQINKKKSPLSYRQSREHRRFRRFQ
jgi:hypothetical protein